eukprot:TRINITY_DN21908_c0_g1_i1.p2 TRINITY_DN21908_c0_g1~~TRINITY_DN21908_c0_g1_i1.p2  ORF type:complete len:112 (+),score=48.93 TRINITY_DN21908_c0_g1_i1:48-383(+)
MNRILFAAVAVLVLAVGALGAAPSNGAMSLEQALNKDPLDLKMANVAEPAPAVQKHASKVMHNNGAAGPSLKNVMEVDQPHRSTTGAASSVTALSAVFTTLLCLAAVKFMH